VGYRFADAPMVAEQTADAATMPGTPDQAF
jgi:hypothetical protein